jgi:hypothetical protein
MTAKQKQVVYWAVDLDINQILQNQQIKNFLDNHSELIQLKKVHSTLFFVGKKKKTDKTDVSEIMGDMNLSDPEEPYIKLNGKECELIINGFGHSENAMALNVQSIKIIEDGTDCPSNAIQQHVTIALKNGIKAVESVKTLTGEGTFEELSSLIVLNGNVKGFFY